MKRIRWLFGHIEEIISIIGLSGMLLTTIYNVIMRYCFSSPKGWATELAVICLVWATFPGAAVCYKKNLHYGMDFLVNKLPMRFQYRLRQAITGLCIVLFIFLTVISIRFTIDATKTTPFFMLSYKFIDLSAVLGFTSMMIYSFIYFIQSFKDPVAYGQRYVNAYIDDDDLGNDRSSIKETTK